jgi:hypothetical protein
MNLKTLLSTLLFAFCVLCFLSVGTPAQETKTTVRRSSGFSGDGYAYKLTDLDFVNTPSWNEDEGEPPLSLARAVKIARENLPRFVKSAESWKMRAVMLQSMGEDKWFYRIHFVCSGAPCRELESRNFMAIVKLDGTVVEPKKVTIEN